MAFKGKKPQILNFDNIVATIATFGVPGLLLTVAVGSTGFAGAAGLTTALAAIGPGGMVGGICVLGIVGIVSQGITKFGFDKILSAVVKELYKQGETKESILRKVENYKVSKSLKRKLKEEVESLE